MKKTKAMLLVLTGLVIALNFSGCSKSKNSNEQSKGKNTQQVSGEPSIFDNKNLFTADVGPFPDFSKYPEFDSLLKMECSEVFHSFETECASNLKSIMAEDPSFSTENPFGYFSRSFTVAQDGPDYISVAVLYTLITSPGPANSFYKTYFWSVKEKQLLGLAAVLPFLGEHSNLESLSKLCYASLVEQLSEQEGYDEIIEEMIREGTEPIQENYKNFTLSNDKITVYFDKYQAAPGAYGVQVVDIAKSEIKLLDEE